MSKKFTLRFKGQKPYGYNDDISYAKNCNGFVFCDGSLKSDIGFDMADFPYPAPEDGRHAIKPFTEGGGKEVIDYMFLYKRTKSDGTYDDRLVVVSDRDIIYQQPLFAEGDFECVYNVTLNGEASSVNFNQDGSDVILLSGDVSYLIMLDDVTAKFNPDSPCFSSLTFHYERVFGTTMEERNRVWFSDDFNPLNWNVSADEGGYIDFLDDWGDLLKVISFMDYVFVFKEDAIMRITAYADQTQFSVAKVAVGVGRILKNSIVLAGESIYFLTTKGLYSFDGYSIREIDDSLPRVTDYASLTACVLDGKYYYAFRADESVPYGDNNAVGIYDLEKKSLAVINDICVKIFLSVSSHHASEVFALIGNDILKVTDSGAYKELPLPKRWKSIDTTFDSTNRKVIKAINVFTSHDIVFKVIADGKTYSFKIAGKNAYQRIRIEKSGYILSFEIECDSAEAEIRPIDFEIETVE